MKPTFSVQTSENKTCDRRVMIHEGEIEESRRSRSRTRRDECLPTTGNSDIPVEEIYRKGLYTRL